RRSKGQIAASIAGWSAEFKLARSGDDGKCSLPARPARCSVAILIKRETDRSISGWQNGDAGGSASHCATRWRPRPHQSLGDQHWDGENENPASQNELAAEGTRSA